VDQKTPIPTKGRESSFHLQTLAVPPSLTANCVFQFAALSAPTIIGCLDNGRLPTRANGQPQGFASAGRPQGSPLQFHLRGSGANFNRFPRTGLSACCGFCRSRLSDASAGLLFSVSAFVVERDAISLHVFDCGELSAEVRMCQGSSHLRRQFIVIGMRTNPESDDSFPFTDSHRPITEAGAHRINRAGRVYLFEVQTWVARILFEEFVGFFSLSSDMGW